MGAAAQRYLSRAFPPTILARSSPYSSSSNSLALYDSEIQGYSSFHHGSATVSFITSSAATPLAQLALSPGSLAALATAAPPIVLRLPPFTSLALAPLLRHPRLDLPSYRELSPARFDELPLTLAFLRFHRHHLLAPRLFHRSSPTCLLSRLPRHGTAAAAAGGSQTSYQAGRRDLDFDFDAIARWSFLPRYALQRGQSERRDFGQ